MARFRTGTLVVDAVPLRWDTWNELSALLGEAFFASGGHGSQDSTGAIGLDIPTPDGVQHAVANDWVVREDGGRAVYAVTPDVFAATYEPA